MLARLLYRVKASSSWLTFILILLVLPARGWAIDLADHASIVEAHLTATPEDLAVARSMAEHARGLSSSARNSQNANFGPLVKLWCDAVTFAPDPENLAECAWFRFKSISQMSNPQPSVEAVRIRLARESLAMIRAALEIAGGDPRVSDDFRNRLRKDSDCFHGIIFNTSASKDCI